MQTYSIIQELRCREATQKDILHGGEVLLLNEREWVKRSCQTFHWFRYIFFLMDTSELFDDNSDLLLNPQC